MKINNKCLINFDKKEAMIFNPTSETIISYNAVGKEIIQFLMKGYDKKRILKELSQIYNVDKKILRKDLNEFLLEQKNLKVVR